jgi:Pyruvate/2-oxoacid:ferredoxin oxidoreductase delta subunit
MGKWSSIYIYYISGTGNARKSCEWIADEAIKNGIEPVVQQIDRLENIEIPEPSEKRLVGFAFPTHGFNAAPIMLRFIASFPRGICKDVFLLNTRAGMKLSRLFLPGLSGIALILPAFILLIKGYRCIAFRPVDLPSNWIPLHPGLKKKVIDSIFVRCERIVRDFSRKLFSGEKIYVGLYSLPIDLLISPVAFGYYIAGRFFLSKTFIANYKCTNCGLCIKECPTSSIKLVNNRPYWKITCESCMRCLNHCPERAIEAAHGMAVLFWFIITMVNSLVLIILINNLKIANDSTLLLILKHVASLAFTVIIPVIIYYIIHYAMAIRPVKYLVRFTSLTFMSFWRRYQPGKRK